MQMVKVWKIHIAIEIYGCTTVRIINPEDSEKLGEPQTRHGQSFYKMDTAPSLIKGKKSLQ